MPSANKLSAANKLGSGSGGEALFTSDQVRERTLTANISLSDSDLPCQIVTADADTWTVNISTRTKPIYFKNNSNTYSFTVLGCDSNVNMVPTLAIGFIRRPSNGKYFY